MANFLRIGVKFLSVTESETRKIPSNRSSNDSRKNREVNNVRVTENVIAFVGLGRDLHELVPWIHFEGAEKGLFEQIQNGLQNALQ